MNLDEWNSIAVGQVLSSTKHYYIVKAVEVKPNKPNRLTLEYASATYSTRDYDLYEHEPDSKRAVQVFRRLMNDNARESKFGGRQ